MAFTSIQKIRFDDVDGAGIVYYPKFFDLCHAAFEDFFDSAAPISYPELIRDRRQGFPTVAIESEFTAPLAYGDMAIIKLSVATIGRSSVSFNYTVRRKRDGVRSFRALITTVFIDLDSQVSLPVPRELRSIFSAFLAAADEEAAPGVAKERAAQPG